MKKYLLIAALFLRIGLYAETYNFARLVNTNGLSNNQIECVFKDSRGFLWIGTNFGLNRYDGLHNKVYKRIKNDTTSLISNAIAGIQEDFTGNLWIRSGSNLSLIHI